MDESEETDHSSRPSPALGQVEALEPGEPRPGEELKGGGGAHQGLGDPHIGPEGGAAPDIGEYLPPQFRQQQALHVHHLVK